MGAVTDKVVTSPQLVVAVKVAFPEATDTVLPITVPLLVVTVALLLKLTVYPLLLQMMFCTVITGFGQIEQTVTVAVTAMDAKL